MKLLIYTSFILLSISACNSKAPSSSNQENKKKTAHAGDTVTFKPVTSPENLPLTFDDNNSITFKNGVKLKAAAEGEDDYSLKIIRNNKTIFSKDSVKGVSKVLLDDNKLFFAVFTYTDEDANNEGNAFIIDLKDNSILKYPGTLKNTCNPVEYKNGYIFLDGGVLIQTSLNLKLISRIHIGYHSSTGDYSFLDTYSINGLAKSLSDNPSFQIIFSPDKTQTTAKTYDGHLTSNTEKIILDNGRR